MVQNGENTGYSQSDRELHGPALGNSDPIDSIQALIPVQTLLLLVVRRKEGDDHAISTPEEALRLVEEIAALTQQVRKTQGLEEGKVEEIERGIDKILRDYSDMNPRRPTRFIRDLTDIATSIEDSFSKGLLSIKQKKWLEITLKKTRMRDFYSARKLLTRFAKPIEIKHERDLKLNQYKTFYKKLENQTKNLKTEIVHLKDIPKPEKSPDEVESIKQMVERYNESASAALTDFFAHAPCKEALVLISKALDTPELGIPAPRNRESLKELLKVLEEEQVSKAFGEENLGRLVEAAGYSEKRLEHFVKDYKWFQRKLQENVGWLTELTTARSDALTLDWSERPEILIKKVEVIELFLELLPRAERALQTLGQFRKLIEGKDYEMALQSDKIYRSHGNMAKAKFDGSLLSIIQKREDELIKVQDHLSHLPQPDRLIS